MSGSDAHLSTDLRTLVTVTGERHAVSRRSVITAGVVGAAGLPFLVSACSSGSSSSQSASPTPTTSPTLPARVMNAQEATDLVLRFADWGAVQGSYGIASILVDNSTGKVFQGIANATDRRLADGLAVDGGQIYPYDPTAHGERQMTYWYYANRAKLNLPDPQALTVITSLDPCAMCTGTLLEAGFNVGVLAIDPYAGINYNGSGKFQDLPEPLRTEALARFGYYAAQGGRAYQGSDSVVFSRDTITQASLDQALAVYQNSAQDPRDARNNSSTDPKQLSDPATGADAAPVRAAYQKALPQAFTVKLANFRKPNAKIRDILQSLVDQAADASNAVAFIDPFGNLVAAAADSFQLNPAATSLQNVLQTYEETRFRLMNDASTNEVANKTLTSPINGTFVFLYAPSMRVATDYANVGAYGSAVGSAAPIPEPSPFQFFYPPQRGNVAEMHKAIDAMAPLYSQHIKINPQKVAS